MKKILLASTALIATAGVAAADISLSGTGRFGLSYVEDRAGANRGDSVLYSRLRINIDGSTETDGGVEFGARLRIQATNDAANNEQNQATLSGARFSVAYGGLEVYIGNTGGAIDNMKFKSGNEPGALFEAGQTAGRDYGGFGYSSGGAGANALYATYAVGDLLFGAGFDDQANGEEVDVFVTYTMGNFGGTLAYGQRNDSVGGDDDTVMLGLDYNVGDLNLTALIGDEDTGTVAQDGLFYGVSANYAISSATAIQFAYGTGEESTDDTAYGIGATHSLGGGVTLAAGVGQTDDGTAAGGKTYASAGVRLSF